MKKFKKLSTEELKELLDKNERITNLAAFNSARVGRLSMIEMCFIRSELIRRQENNG